MCILFIKLLKAAKKGEFKFILASNRDEIFKRPGKSAHFWEEDPNIFGGRDMTESKEGGTWLAMSKTGRLGVLLNVTGEEMDPNKLGRGFLAADFVKGNMTELQYIDNISRTGHQYNKFHLITASLGQTNPSLVHYSNDSAGTTEIPGGVFACSNSSIAEPFQKVIKGRQRFEKIIADTGYVDEKEQLIKDLLSFLKWEDQHYPDSVIDSLCNMPLEYKQQYSSVFVNMPKLFYGTRTHTIILVDWQGNTDFLEWTLKEPISVEGKEWKCTHQTFKLES